MRRRGKSQIVWVSMLILLLIVGSLQGFRGTARASGSTYLGVAGDFNFFIFKDLNMSNSDVEGRVAVGGNASFANYSINSEKVPGEQALIVKKDLVFSNGQINSGDAVYGGSLTVSGLGIPDGELRQGNIDNVMDFENARLDLIKSSSELANLLPNGIVNSSEPQPLKLKGEDPVLNVFSIDQNIGELWLDVPEGSTTIINVSGTNRVMGTAGYFNIDPQRVLFNFYEATLVQILDGGVKGSVLAPKAHIQTTYGQIDGTLVADSIIGSIEGHHVPFIDPPLVPTPSPTPSVTPSPTPSVTPSPTPSETPSPTPSETP
ncbi:choice-of-anchor A family protein, partial [Paenibacillus segetis]|uniref:choice-of-anchor A family protein n=1 Tax=Paenibacillus segetis TaxID=1325360 RepID=UPI00166AF80F